MGDTGRHMTFEEAAQLRRRWQGTRQVSEYEIDRVLAELEHALDQLDTARRIMRRLVKVWPGVRNGVTALEEWVDSTSGAPIGRPTGA